MRSFLLDMGNTASQEKKSEKMSEKDTSTVMYNLTFSHVISQYLYVVAKLDVASIIGKAGKPLTAEQIAKENGGTINVDYLQRILRLLSSTHGIFSETRVDEEGLPAFGLTKLSQLLRSDNPDEVSFKYYLMTVTEAPDWNSWSRLEECVMSSEPKVPFILEHIVGLFDHYRVHPESGDVFNKAMTRISLDCLDHIMTAYSSTWAELEKMEATVLDVGGGHGQVMKKVKEIYPKLNCKVLDLKEVIESVAGEDCGVEFVVGDFFKPETLPKADVIFMKLVMHDWNDENCKKILDSCHLALSEGGKLIVCESVLPDAGESVKAQEGPNPFFLDAHLLAVLDGKERCGKEWSELFEASSFKLERIVETSETLAQLIEGRKL